MREIKFRAWNKKTKSFRSEGDWVITPDGKIRWLHIGEETLLQSETSNLILMQWTGLQDKNGKDIYEGDIIKNNTKRSECHSSVVEWNENTMGFMLKCSCGKWWFSHSSLQISGEVIGNIYEDGSELI